jgi:CheY-like chemotaxis protein
MSRRILLADDSVTIQKVIELTFMDEDFEVQAVSNGDEAIAALSERPDFVIADVHMPGANGYEVCRRAKQTLPGVPVLLLVGTFEPFDEGQARAAGADSFLKKPFDSQELLQRVQELSAAHAPASQPASMPASPPAPPAPEAALTMPPVPAAPPAASAPPPVEEDFALPALDLEPEPAAPVFTTGPAWEGFELSPEPEPAPRREDPFALREEPFAHTEEPTIPKPAPMETVDHSFGGDDRFVLEEDSSLSIEEPIGLRDETAEPVFAEPQDRFLDEVESPLMPAVPEAEPGPAMSSMSSPWELTDQERLGIPLGEEPLVDSLAETEERIASPWPEAFESAEGTAPHEPAATLSAPSAAFSAPSQPAATVLEGPWNGGGRLSDEDIDRIARRVVELVGDKAVRDIAWEVVPDLAEVAIKDRLRELERQVD